MIKVKERMEGAGRERTFPLISRPNVRGNESNEVAQQHNSVIESQGRNAEVVIEFEYSLKSRYINQTSIAS